MTKPPFRPFSEPPPLIEAGRLCIHCTEFDVNFGWAGTEVTPGEGTTVECKRSIWSMGNWDGTDQFRRNILKAERCVFFKSIHTDG